VGAGPALFLAALLLHGGGFLLGWLIPRRAEPIFGDVRTLSIEVRDAEFRGTLAVVLARHRVRPPPHSTAPTRAILGSCVHAVCWKPAGQLVREE